MRQSDRKYMSKNAQINTIKLVNEIYELANQTKLAQHEKSIIEERLNETGQEITGTDVKVVLEGVQANHYSSLDTLPSINLPKAIGSKGSRNQNMLIKDSSSLNNTGAHFKTQSERALAENNLLR